MKKKFFIEIAKNIYFDEYFLSEISVSFLSQVYYPDLIQIRLIN